METLGIGIIGSGFAANIHANALKRVMPYRIELRGVCSRSRENAEAFARRFGIPCIFTDYRSMLDRRDIDVVDLCVPTHLHHSMALDAAAAGKHIICEKPLTGFFGEGKQMIGETVSRKIMLSETLRAGREILDAVKTNTVRFCYGENFVYAPAVTRLKALIEKSGGMIMDIRAEESHSGSHAQYARRWNSSGGGSLLRLGSHPVGAVLHLKHFEGEIRSGRPIRARSVIADLGHLIRLEAFRKQEPRWMVDDWEDVEDWSAALITFEDGSKATIHASDVSLGGIKNLMTVYMSNAAAFININPNNSLVVYSPDPGIFGSEYITEKVETKAGWQFPSPDEDWMRGYPQEMEDFISAILQGREPVSGTELAYEVLELIYAAYLSSETGQKVELRRDAN